VTWNEQLSPRRGATRLLGRWVLIALVLAGVFAMHVLAQHDAADGGHGMLMEPHATAMAPALSSSTDRVMTGGNAGPAPESAAVGPGAELAAVPASAVAPSGGDSTVEMACCVLFLTAAGALVLSLLLASGQSAAAAPGTRHPAFLPTYLRGPPPGPAPPRISLCVLRV